MAVERKIKNMENGSNRASIFVFTSFQGGIGKSSSAYRFARAFQKARGVKGALLEVNRFTPSYLIESLNLKNQLKNSFIDFFMSNWVGFTGEQFESFFTEIDNLFLIPFVGIHTRESLKTKFTFHDSEAEGPLQRMINSIYQRDSFLVVDLPFAMAPLPIIFLEQADAIFYVYDNQAPSPTYATTFLEECKRMPGIADKVIFLRNHSDTETEKGELCLFENEAVIPLSDSLTGEEGDQGISRAFETLAKRALTLNRCPPPVKERAELEATVSTELLKLQEYQKILRSQIVASLDKKFGMSDQELRLKVEQFIENAFRTNPPPLLTGVDVKTEIRRFLIDEILGLGPLEEFMRDPEVDEIMVNGPNKIFLEKGGRLILSNRTFNNIDHVKAVIDRILMPVGRTINERNPYVDARLIDGSRAHAIIPPLSLTGPMLTIRKFSKIPITIEDLVYRFGTMTPQVADFLKLCVQLRKNVIVSGGASSGKTTLLNVLSQFISPNERVISIEDSAELRLNMANLGRLEARQQGTEAKNQVTIRDLVRNALRMRPDRIIVGECRSDEALDMLQAMNTGHDGSLTTLHANSPRDALARLETMVLMAGVDLPLRAIREQIASSVNIVIQANRFSDGTRKILEVVEIVGIEDTTILTQSLFKYEKKWINEEGRVYGDLIPTGVIPAFISSMPTNLSESYRHLFTQTTASQ